MNLKITVQSVGDADTLARKAANTLAGMGNYANLGTSDRTWWIVWCRHSILNLEKSIYNVRIGAFCNRIRYDFVGTKSRSTMKEKNGWATKTVHFCKNKAIETTVTIMNIMKYGLNPVLLGLRTICITLKLVMVQVVRYKWDKISSLMYQFWVMWITVTCRLLCWQINSMCEMQKKKMTWKLCP